MNNVELLRQTVSSALSILLVLAMIGSETGAIAYQSQGTPPSKSSSPNYAGQGTPQTTEELQGLVAPIALYPDALVAQILNAATFPDQAAVAQYWLEANKNLTGSALTTAVDKQSWDPSIKALTQFPSVLDNMAKNMAWTSQLGEAYHNQQAEVMSAIQTLRAKAKQGGNLKSGSQITVVQQSPQTIVIQPTNPQVIYVPQYNPTVIYGTPYTTPGYSTGALVATGLLSFGAGMAVGAAMGGGCCGWGYSSWSCNWYGGGALYHGAPYYGNAAWHGGYYGGYNNYGYHSYNNSYNGGYHSNYNGKYNSTGYHPNNVSNSGYNRTGQNNYSHNTNVSGNTVNVNTQKAAAHTGDASSFDEHASSGGWGSSDAARGWGSHSDSGGSSAFSGWGGHSGSSFGGGGWGSRASSSRGWASRGGGGGWGGGRGGGGFRR